MIEDALANNFVDEVSLTHSSNGWECTINWYAGMGEVRECYIGVGSTLPQAVARAMLQGEAEIMRRARAKD